jgi:DNA-binding NarL/FixJ family response regulator
MMWTLLVEDSDTFRETLSGILHTHFPSIGIEEAADGKVALRKVEYVHPELIFMDIKLPDGNGLELTRKIKLDHSGIVIVILSSYDLPEYRQAAFRNGADCFISKDDVCCMVDIIARVEGMLATKKLEGLAG